MTTSASFASALLICAAALVTACSGRVEHERFVAFRAPEGPARLLYAPVGTRILLINAINGAPVETEVTVGRADGIFGTYRNGAAETGAYLPGCWGCTPGMQISPQAYGALWPLQPGKQVRFRRIDAGGQAAEVTISVTGTERLATPLGEFETYVLDGRIQHVGGAPYSAQMRSWWAPGLGWVIKTAGGDSRGNTFESQIADFTLF